MGANDRGPLPSDLVRGRARFQTWRERRALGERIPQPLWSLAVRLAKTHGVSRTSAALGLDHYSLKKRADASATAPPPSSGPAFVEITAPVMAAKQCRVELDNGSGAIMRVQLVGYDAADIEAIARGFWDAR
jgi:hypothetical protein